jgi:hypothetical protein
MTCSTPFKCDLSMRFGHIAFKPRKGQLVVAALLDLNAGVAPGTQAA